MQAGVTPGDRVAICLNRFARSGGGAVAVHKIGGTYVPLDPTYPAERIQYVLPMRKSPYGH